MDKHGFLDGPGMTVDLLMHYVKLFWVHWVSYGDAVVVYGGGGLEMFLKTLSPNDLPDSPI